MKKFLLIPLVALAVSACGNSNERRCMKEFEYQKAQTLPSPAPVDGVKMPESGAALKIPAEPVNKVPFAEYIPDPNDPGERDVSCLDVPPPLPARPEPAAR